VDVDIDHTYQGDLIVAVTSPSGTSFTLQNRTGGSADDIKKSFSIDASSEPSNGVWNLLVKDRANADVGTLNEWSITFSSQ
jgi:aminopeptidase S